MSTLIPTGVADTAAAHLAYIRASTSTEDYLTIVWSTRRIRCVPGDPGHASAQWDEETVPMVWDSTGCGDWDVGDHVQCGSDGVLLYPHARIAEGHLPDEQVRDLALQVAREAGTHPAVDVVTLVYTVKVHDGTATAGDRGTLIITWYDGSRPRRAVGYIGEDGLKPDTPYRVNGRGEFYEVEK